MIDIHNISRQAHLKIERKYGTQQWDMQVNISIFSVIIVDWWNFLKGVMHENYKDSERNFYTKLAEEMIDNIIDNAHQTRLHVQCLGVYTEDGLAASWFSPHLTHTRNKRKVKGERKIFLKQFWCYECRREKKYKKTCVFSNCWDEEGELMDLPFFHPKSGHYLFL